MPTVYKVTVENKPGPAYPGDRYTLTWQNLAVPAVATQDSAPAAITAAEVANAWQNPERQLETGVKLFGFLDGEKHLLQGALDDAARLGEPLTLLLCTCKPTADWPFELLAQGQAFLLPQRLHLVRCVSAWGADTQVPPRGRPLKLLFMACSTLDVKPELDFEREEEFTRVYLQDVFKGAIACLFSVPFYYNSLAKSLTNT
jgi:hypothetical protein